MARRHPDVYKFPMWGNIALYTTLMVAHYMYAPERQPSSPAFNPLI